MKTRQRNLMETAEFLWSEATELNDHQTNRQPALVDAMHPVTLFMREALRLEAANPVVPLAHPLHD